MAATTAAMAPSSSPRPMLQLDALVDAVNRNNTDGDFLRVTVDPSTGRFMPLLPLTTTQRIVATVPHKSMLVPSERWSGIQVQVQAQDGASAEMTTAGGGARGVVTLPGNPRGTVVSFTLWSTLGRAADVSIWVGKGSARKRVGKFRVPALGSIRVNRLSDEDAAIRIVPEHGHEALALGIQPASGLNSFLFTVQVATAGTHAVREGLLSRLGQRTVDLYAQVAATQQRQARVRGALQAVRACVDKLDGAATSVQLELAHLQRVMGQDAAGGTTVENQSENLGTAERKVVAVKRELLQLCRSIPSHSDDHDAAAAAYPWLQDSPHCGSPPFMGMGAGQGPIPMGGAAPPVYRSAGAPVYRSAGAPAPTKGVGAPPQACGAKGVSRGYAVFGGRTGSTFTSVASLKDPVMLGSFWVDFVVRHRPPALTAAGAPVPAAHPEDRGDMEMPLASACRDPPLEPM